MCNDAAGLVSVSRNVNGAESTDAVIGHFVAKGNLVLGGDQGGFSIMVRSTWKEPVEGKARDTEAGFEAPPPAKTNRRPVRNGKNDRLTPNGVSAFEGADLPSP